MLPARGAPQDCMTWWPGKASMRRVQRHTASGQLPVTPPDAPVLWECSVKAQALGKATYPSAFSRHFLFDPVILLLQLWPQSTYYMGIRIKIIYGIHLCDNRSLATTSTYIIGHFSNVRNDTLIEICNCSHWEEWRQYFQADSQDTWLRRRILGQLHIDRRLWRNGLAKVFPWKRLRLSWSHLLLVVPPDPVFWFPRNYGARTWHGSWHRVGLHCCWNSSRHQADHCPFALAGQF